MPVKWVEYLQESLAFADKNGWNILPAYSNAKNPIPNWKQDGYQEKQFPRRNLLSYEGCNFLVVTGKTSNNLSVIDFDLEDEYKHTEKLYEVIDNLPEKLKKTRMVETQSGGLHVYFRTNGWHDVKLKIPCKIVGVNHIDIPYLAMIPPSIVNGNEYKYLNNNAIQIFDDEEITEIINSITIQKEQPAKSDTSYIKGEYDFSNLYECHKDVLDGTIDIRKMAGKTGKTVRQYWRMFYYDIYRRTRTRITEEMVNFIHNNYDIKWDLEKQLQQIPHLKYNTPKTQMATLLEYYPDYDPTKDANTEEAKFGNRLIEEFNLITDSESDIIYSLRDGNFVNAEIEIDEFNTTLTKYCDISGKGFDTIERRILRYIKRKTKTKLNLIYNNNIIPFQNGYYDIVKSTLTPYESNEVMPYKLPHEYKVGEYKCPEFEKLISQWLDKRSLITIDDIYQMIGYTMSMNVGEKVAFFIYGPSNTGKTQFLNILSYLVGHDNTATVKFSELVGDKFTQESMRFCPLNKSSETANFTVREFDTFLTIAGGDNPLSFRGMYKGKVQYWNITKIWNAGNNIPLLSNEIGYTEAFYNRWIILRFPYVFEQSMDEFERQVWEIIRDNPDEIQGIIHKSIEGYKQVISGGFREKIRHGTKRIWQRESDPIYRYLEDFCIDDEDGAILTSEFHRAFNIWRVENKRKKLSPDYIRKRMEFNEVFKDKPFEDRREYYVGITWKPESEAEVRKF